MDEVQVKTIEIGEKIYILLDSIADGKNTYHFFSAMGDPNDIQVLKDKIEKEDTYYISLDTEVEFDYALSLFYDKYHNKVDSSAQVSYE